jgi:hypothetical protein
MTDTTSEPQQELPTATPPAEGRQDHLAMRAAAMLPISGPASTDTLASSGGLEIPGGDAASAVARLADLPILASQPEPIPGAYETDTAMHRQPGAIGGCFNGADTPSVDASVLMDEDVREEHRREGGGGHHGR